MARIEVAPEPDLVLDAEARAVWAALAVELDEVMRWYVGDWQGAMAAARDILTRWPEYLAARRAEAG